MLDFKTFKISTSGWVLSGLHWVLQYPAKFRWDILNRCGKMTIFQLKEIK